MRRMRYAALVLLAVFTAAVVRWWVQDRTIAKVPMFRAVGADGVDEFLTTSLDEKTAAVAGGYQDKPVPFFVSGEPRPDLIAIDRLLSPDRRVHYYTSRPEELQALLAKGWTHERKEGYLRAEGRGRVSEVYSLYNASTASHRFTMSRDELKAALASGWQQQASLGYAWRAP